MKRLFFSILLMLAFSNRFAQGYENFKVAIYCPVGIVEKMSEGDYLEKSFEFIGKNFHADKVYLETHRHGDLISENKLLKVKRFFESKGIKVAGGITATGKKPIANHMRVYCYSDENNLAHLKKTVEFTAKHFDEIILDDFFFTTCKCEKCIKAKGERSWENFRSELMVNVARNVILKTAKSVNPNVKMVIKYPNWYEYYYNNGYNLEKESELFDGVYIGTETRDPVFTHQNLQPYQSYSLVRYLENVKPGKNGGGWIDPLDKRFLERYAEQIRLTLFAKAKEVTLFHYGALFEILKDGKVTGTVAPVAANVFSKTDVFLGQLGNPAGLASYRPYRAHGEEFLHNYLGMLGIPVELTPEFPADAKTVLITEGAKADAEIIGKLKEKLLDGGNVIITSGFLKAMRNKGIRDIIQAEVTGRKFFAEDFTDLNFKNISHAKTPILFPEISFATNDSWEEVIAIGNGNGFPVLLSSNYGKGMVYVLVVPDNFADLYSLPEETISMIKKHLLSDLPVKINAPAQIAQFYYDNGTFIVHSFLPNKAVVKIEMPEEKNSLTDLLTDKKIKTNCGTYEFVLKPYSYRVFEVK